MTLSDDAKSILANFNSVSIDDFIRIIQQIRPHLQTPMTQEYLQAKISAISDAKSEEEKKKLCKNLLPYLDWYVSGQ